MDLNQMIEALTRNELDWLIGGNASETELEDSVRFFARGGFTQWSDGRIRAAHEGLAG